MGPLAGIRILEMAGIGPGPFCAMMLSDMGAEVLRIDRNQPSGLGIQTETKFSVLSRGRRSVSIDLKSSKGIETVLRLMDRSDALLDPWRPGVAERLGIGPDVCLDRNPKLVYGRMTGWGQDGPMAPLAGHDINYIALSGALHSIGETGRKPVPPLNLVGDFGGGGIYLVVGILCGLLEAKSSGKGQVVDVSMVEGSASLMSSAYGHHAAGLMTDQRGANTLDGGAHFYDTYETSDGKYVAVGSLEGKFYKLLLQLTGLENEDLPGQSNREKWPEMKERLAEIFKTKTRDEWCRIMEGTDVCFAPVLSMAEAPHHPHNQARNSFVEIDGVVQPAPAPKFSRTQPQVQSPPARPGEHTETALADWGFEPKEIERLKTEGAIGWQGP
ncbi:MAG: CoA transferase [Proteobacteria bacterium]|nr:CoA transferase [Pseudomonadota bacterium]